MTIFFWEIMVSRYALSVQFSYALYRKENLLRDFVRNN